MTQNWEKEIMKILINWHYENIREEGVFKLKEFISKLLQAERKRTRREIESIIKHKKIGSTTLLDTQVENLLKVIKNK